MSEYNFKPGRTYVWPLDGGPIREATWRDKFRWRLSDVWRRLTWWRHTRTVVSAIDKERGVVTCTTQRWSWREWKWTP